MSVCFRPFHPVRALYTVNNLLNNETKSENDLFWIWIN